LDKEELKNRTKEFAHRCINVCAELPNNALGNIMRGQLLRSSTSVAANYRATCVAQSKASFVSKLSIVIEEVDESEFWLQMIIDEKIVKKERVLPLVKEANELTSIFVSSRKTAGKRD